MAIESAKIAKNTSYLYLRMLITMGITFYTSRVILDNLGFTDYGIFSVVGGIAVIFSFLNNSLASSSQRYLTYAIGKGEKNYITKVFSIAVVVHILIALIIALLSECIGLWIILYKLDIPQSKITDAIIVFQCTLAISIVSIINVPYTAAIIAEERLNFFAKIGIIETIIKLMIAYLIILFPNRLISYSVLLLIISILIFFSTRIYCALKLKGMNLNLKYFDPSLCKEMISFTGWHIFRNGAMICVSQGNNVLVNIFGGPIASAAMGLLTQVSSGIARFMTSIQTAFSPQITKNYSNSDTSLSIKLVIISTKISSLLFFLISIPLAINMNFILKIWLESIPDNTALFCLFGLGCLFFESISVPMDTLIMANGKIKRYEMLSSLIWITSIILAYVALKIGMSFKYILSFRIIAGLTYVLYESYYLKGIIAFCNGEYIVNALIKPIITGILCIIITTTSIRFFTNDIVRLITSIIITSLILIIFSWHIVFNKIERAKIKYLVKRLPVLSKIMR